MAAETRTTAQIIRDAKIRAAKDPVLARAAARELARRQATRMRSNAPQA